MSKIYLNPKETIIYKVGGLAVLTRSWFFKFIRFVFIAAGLAGIVYQLAIVGKFTSLDRQLFGLSLIAIALMLLISAFNYYYRGFLVHPELHDLKKIKEAIGEGEPVNLWHFFSLELSSHLLATGQNWQGAINSQKLTLLLLDSQEIEELMIRLAIPKNDLVTVLKNQSLKEENPQKIFLKALDIAEAEEHQQIEIGDLFLALALYDPILKRFIFALKIEPEDIANVIYWQTKAKRSREKRRKIFDPNNLALTGGIGRDWAYGYTQVLAQFSTDLSETVKAGGFTNLELEAKEKEISQIEEALTRAGNHNVILIGSEGIGKKTTIHGLAKKIYEGKSTSVLSNRRLLELDIEALLAGCHDPNEVVSRIQTIFNEAVNAGNIILFIDNLANIVSNDEKVGRVNALDALAPYLEHPNIYIIGTANPKDYRNYFATSQLLESHFVKVELHEPNFDETVRIVEDILPQIEGRTRVLVTYEAIKEAIKLTDKFIQNLPQPLKSINLLDQVATKKATEGGSAQRALPGGGLLLPEDIDVTMENQTNVPIGELQENEKEILMKLEDNMHRRVVGQREAISAIANALRRVRAGVVDSKKPIGSFLFLGPTGVGKTEMAKTLAALYFGSEEAMIRFDMSEYQEKGDIYRLIGDPEDESSQGLLTSAVREKPFSLILFDEVEKADPNILNLFLQILDEGNVTDAFGQKCSFSNAIIILTSNAGSDFILKAMRANQEYGLIQKQLMEFVVDQGLFRPEFLNRFTQVVVFRPLTFEEIIQIAHFMIEKLAKVLEKERGISIEIDEQAVKKLAELGFDPKMGARPMQRSIQEHLENVIAKRILSSQINRGDHLAIRLQDLEV